MVACTVRRSRRALRSRRGAVRRAAAATKSAVPSCRQDRCCWVLMGLLDHARLLLGGDGGGSGASAAELGGGAGVGGQLCACAGLRLAHCGVSTCKAVATRGGLFIQRSLRAGVVWLATLIYTPAVTSSLSMQRRSTTCLFTKPSTRCSIVRLSYLASHCTVQ